MFCFGRIDVQDYPFECNRICWQGLWGRWYFDNQMLPHTTLASENPALGCWTRQVIDACGDLERKDELIGCLRAGQKINMGVLVADLRTRYDAVWSKWEGKDPRSSEAHGRNGSKLITYLKWFAEKQVKNSLGEMKCPLPSYLTTNMGKHLIRDMARLRLSSHDLRVETGRYTGLTYDNRVCRLCDTGAIEDEQHILLECPDDMLGCYRDSNAFMIIPRNCGNFQNFLRLNLATDVAHFTHACFEWHRSCLAEQPSQAGGQM